MPYRMGDDSVTVKGKGRPRYSGKSVTRHGNQLRNEKGAESGRYDSGPRDHPEKQAGRSTARDVTSVRPQSVEPLLPKKMPNLR